MSHVFALGLCEREARAKALFGLGMGQWAEAHFSAERQKHSGERKAQFFALGLCERKARASPWVCERKARAKARFLG